MTALTVYGVTMALIAAVLLVLALGSRPVGEWNSEVASAALVAGVPAWSALAAAAVVAVLKRRSSAASGHHLVVR